MCLHLSLNPWTAGRSGNLWSFHRLSNQSAFICDFSTNTPTARTMLNPPPPSSSTVPPIGPLFAAITRTPIACGPSAATGDLVSRYHRLKTENGNDVNVREQSGRRMEQFFGVKSSDIKMMPFQSSSYGAFFWTPWNIQQPLIRLLLWARIQMSPASCASDCVYLGKL